MGNFNKGGKWEIFSLNTLLLPDILFIVLFFFMAITIIRGEDLKTQLAISQGTELDKLEKKSLTTFIYIGRPNEQYRERLGNESRIQLNDRYVKVSEVPDFIQRERANMKEEDRPRMTVSLKVDEKTKMGIVADVKNALRRVYGLNINYSVRKRGE